MEVQLTSSTILILSSIFLPIIFSIIKLYFDFYNFRKNSKDDMDRIQANMDEQRQRQEQEVASLNKELKEVSEQRHEDSMQNMKILNRLDNTLTEVKTTMSSLDETMKHFHNRLETQEKKINDLEKK